MEEDVSLKQPCVLDNSMANFHVWMQISNLPVSEYNASEWNYLLPTISSVAHFFSVFITYSIFLHSTVMFKYAMMLL